jgi:hypothetical protein
MEQLLARKPCACSRSMFCSSENSKFIVVSFVKL